MSMMVAPLKQTLHLALNSSAPNQTNTYTVSSVQEAVSLTPELQVSLATLFGSCQEFFDTVDQDLAPSFTFEELWRLIEPNAWMLDADALVATPALGNGSATIVCWIKVDVACVDTYSRDGPVQLYVYESGFGLASLSLKCLAIINVFKLYKIPFITITTASESVSPTGDYPLLVRDNGELVSSFAGMINYAVARANIPALSPADTAAAAAMRSLVLDTMNLALDYELWCEPTQAAATQALFLDNRYAKPLGWLLARQHRHKVEQSWRKHSGSVPTRAKVLMRAQQALGVIAVQLEEATTPFFFGDTPRVIDVVISSLTHLTAHLPGLQALHELVKAEPRLTQHAELVSQYLEQETV
eukprot:m.83633 g.83633  ORF g.83633 m.83633 type:complete len:357 (+) comp14655_c0_seq49:5-1075(+)